MKTFLLITGFLIFGLTSAQNSINYKAIIKDSNGNVLDTETISVRFGIIDESTSTTVYREEFASVETNQNGLIILEIGSGSASIGTYNAINWNSGNNYMLKVEVDLQDGSGYVDMGNSPFNAVPFAKVASTIAKIPSRTLEVAGDGLQRLRINSENGITTSLELMRTGAFTDWRIENSSTWLDFLISEDDFSSSEYKFSFHKDGRLGINNSNPIEALHVSGTIRSSDLAGTGTRAVSANASGNLIIDSSPKIQYQSLNTSIFNARTPPGLPAENAYVHSQFLAGASGSVIFDGSLILPHGAVINKMKVFFIDNTSSSNITFKLSRNSNEFNVSTPIATFISSGASSDYRSLETSGDLNHTVNNISNSYVVSINSTNWQAANLMLVTGVLVTYTLP